MSVTDSQGKVIFWLMAFCRSSLRASGPGYCGILDLHFLQSTFIPCMVSELSCAPLVSSRFCFVSSTFKYHMQSPNAMDSDLLPWGPILVPPGRLYVPLCALLALNCCSPFIRVLDIFSFNFRSKCGPSPLPSLCICSLFSFNCHFNCAIYSVPSFDCILLPLFDFLRDADKFGFTISNHSSTSGGCSYVLPIRSSLEVFN